MDMMSLRRTPMDKAYEPPFTKCVQTGNPLVFNTNVEKGMKITVPSVQSGTPAQISATGTNIWDEQWENSLLNSDGTLSESTRVTSKNFIPVIPGETYMFIWPKGIGRGRCAFYNANKTFVQYNSNFPDNLIGAGDMAGGTITVPSGAYYMKFSAASDYGSTYGNNFSLNYPANDLEYHQHYGAEHSVTVPSTEIQAANGTNVLQNNLNADMTVEFQCEDPKENKLVVMTYNVQYFYGLNADEEMQEEILDEYGASIIGFQEFRRDSLRQTPEKTVVSPRYWNIQVSKSTLPDAIATNYGLSNVTSHFFTNQASGENKGYVTAEMKYKGKTIFLVSAHLTTESHETEKVAQMGELFSLVGTKESFILMGDMNTTCLSKSDTEYTTMIKQFVDEGYNVANCSDQHGFIGTDSSGHSYSSSFMPRDNIITSADFTMSNVRRDTIKLDAAVTQEKEIDHLALICELTL